MGPVRGNKKRKVEKKAEEKSMIFGASQKGSDWWDEVTGRVTGGPSSSFDLEFKSTFKMSKNTFDYICSLVQDPIMSKTQLGFINGNPLSLHDHVALALRRLSSGQTLISIGQSFGTHHSTVSQVTWRFVEALQEKGIHHIQWPSTQEEMAKIKFEFEKIRGLPNCCGAIDSTHIKLLLASSNQEADTWRDHNDKHSMILQVVVDPALRFRDVVTGLPGSMNATLLLQDSIFLKNCRDGEKLNGEKIPETGIREYIVGDLKYPLLPWLVTPYHGTELPENKEDLNERINATYSVAEKALIALKESWKMIQSEMCRPDKLKLPSFVLVCCILHNIVIDMEEQVFEEGSVEHDDPGYAEEVCKFASKGGANLREKLAALFSGR